jgi:predicted kinase
MIKLLNLITEQTGSPKAIIMAGGAGAGKSFLLNQLQLGSLPLINPDKYIEDPDHPAFNNLGAGARQADKEAEELGEQGTSFVWDTTASNPKKIQGIIDSGYDVYMIMVYTHPMISYISNFSRSRNVPSVAVFSTWRNVYQLIEQYNKMLKGNLSIFVNTREGKFDKEVEAFNTAAKNGAEGIKDYLKRYNEEKGIEGSSFFKPVEMSSEEEVEFSKAVVGINYNKDSRGEDKALKKEFLKSFQANGVGPGQDKLKAALKKYKDTKRKSDERNDAVLDNISEMLFSPIFQELLKHSSVKEIDSRVQNFLS